MRKSHISQLHGCYKIPTPGFYCQLRSAAEPSAPGQGSDINSVKMPGMKLWSILQFAPLLLIAMNTHAQVITYGCRFTYQIQTIQIDGHSIPIELYLPNDPHPHPLVMMIHGTAGVFTRTAAVLPEEDNFGEQTLAEHCFVVVLPHYFAEFDRSSMTELAEVRNKFATMRSTLQTILADAESLPNVRGCPTVLLGESLGGYLAVSLGFRDPSVSAVSEFSGGLPVQDIDPRNTALSLLIQHGDADDFVPLSNAFELEKYAQAHHIQVEKQIYVGQSHLFDPVTRKLVLKRSVMFFDSVMLRLKDSNSCP